MCNLPELYCLIQRDNGDVEPVISQERMQVIISIFGFILSLSIILIFAYKNTLKMGNIFWGLLTPGQQWLELSMIISGIGILILIKLVTDELTTNLIKKFENLKEQNAENAKIIVELEEENARLNRKIAELEKKAEVFRTINIVVE